MNEETIYLIAQRIGNLLPFLLVGLGIAIYQKRRRHLKALPKQPIVIAVVLGLLVALTLHIQQSTSREADVEVRRVVQPADGATDADLTPAFVQQTADYILAQLNNEVPDFHGSSTSSVVEKGGKRLGVIRVTTRGVTPVVTVMAFEADQFVRVNCSATDLSDLDVGHPVCARALEAAFGTTLDG